MRTLNYSVKQKDDPNQSPGSWKDSTLVFKVKGPKHKLEKIVQAIQKEICSMED